MGRALSYGTPALPFRGEFPVRLRADGEVTRLTIDYDERDLRMQADPETFYITDHSRGHPALLVRLATVCSDDLRELLELAWRRIAPQRLVAAYRRKA